LPTIPGNPELSNRLSIILDKDEIKLELNDAVDLLTDGNIKSETLVKNLKGTSSNSVSSTI
jgi:hypothetical protein